MFYIGEEVVCVDDVFRDGKKPVVRGQHYIVRWIGTIDGDPCIRVEGVVRAVDSTGRRDFTAAKTIYNFLQLVVPDDPRTIDMGERIKELDNMLDDFPMRATRFRSLKKDHVEEMKKLLNVVPTKVLEIA